MPAPGGDGWGSDEPSVSANGGGGWGNDEPSTGGNSGWGGDGNSGGGCGGSTGGRACFNCGEFGHMSRECPAPRKTGGRGNRGGGGGRSGGWGNDEPSTSGNGGGGWGDDGNSRGGVGSWGGGPGTGGGRGGGGAGDRACFNCGKSGHVSRECSTPRKPGGRGNRGGGGGRSGGWGNDEPSTSGNGGGGWGDDGTSGGGGNSRGGGSWGGESSAGGGRGKSGGGAGGRACFNCGESGHMSRQCPAPRKPGGRSDRGGGGGGGWGAENSEKIPAGADKTQNSGWGDAADNSGGWGDGAKESAQKTSWVDGDGNLEHRKRFRSDDHNQNNEQGDERPAPYKPEELNLEEEVQLQGEGVGENFQRYKDQKVTCLPKDVVIPIEKFEEIISSDVLRDNIKSQKYSDMTPIQKWAIPAIMDGHDIIGCAQTGSGKTAAFILPVLQTILKLDREPNDPNSDCQYPYCLIISPTRELAHQIYVHANMLAKDSIVRCHAIYGQISTAHLKSRLSTGCHVLVATPGRLKDFVGRGWVGFKNIRYVVLDEGDRLVDEGFTTVIREFFNHKSMPPKEKRQTLFFSATFKESTQLNAREYLRENFIFLTVGRVGAANEDIQQEFLCVARPDKKRELKNILDQLPDNEKTIIFTQTKATADWLAGFFNALQLSATSIHGDRHQSQREQAIRAFRRGEKRFLISSPVGNRGLDLPQVALVINYELPTDIDEYVHRIGRTGRAGHKGRAISFYDETRDSELLPYLVDILTEAKQEIPDWMTGSSNPAATTTPTTNDNDNWGASGAGQTEEGSSSAPQTDAAPPATSDAFDEVW